MSSTLRRKALNKDKRKIWRAERDRRGATWAQRKGRSKEFCAPSR